MSKITTIVDSIISKVNNCAKLNDDQTIDGVKTFTSSPIVPTPTAGDNSTNVATTAFVKAKSEADSIGVNQTWQNVTASRVNNVTYTNTTGKPIMVNVNGSSIITTGLMLFVGSELVSYVGQYVSADDIWATLTAIVPAGATYRFHTEQGVINFWYELR